MLACCAAVATTSILGLSGGLLSATARPCQRPFSYLAQRCPSKIGIRDENRKWGPFRPSSASLVTPIPAKPRQPREKSHPSLQCHNWADWVAERVGFEPTCPVTNRTRRFRGAPVTTTSVPLRASARRFDDVVKGRIGSLELPPICDPAGGGKSPASVFGSHAREHRK